MWLWILLTALTIGNFILATPELASSEYAPEETPSEDALFLYMDERSLEPPRRDNRDIETRRRSALDKNFMRFGRSNSYATKNYGYDTDDLENEEFVRDTRSRSKNDNYIRFGRGRGSDFMRFGRDPYMSRMSRQIKDKNFIRFGRSVPLKRSRRDVYSTEAAEEQYKRGNNRDMLRFGRRDNFLRFGRFPFESQDSREKQSSRTNDNQTKHVFPEYASLVDLLHQLTLRMQNKNVDVPRMV